MLLEVPNRGRGRIRWRSSTAATGTWRAMPGDAVAAAQRFHHREPGIGNGTRTGPGVAAALCAGIAKEDGKTITGLSARRSHAIPTYGGQRPAG